MKTAALVEEINAHLEKALRAVEGADNGAAWEAIRGAQKKLVELSKLGGDDDAPRRRDHLH